MIGAGGSIGLRLCRNRLVSLFLTNDSGSACGSSAKDQGLKGLVEGSLSGLSRSSLKFGRIRFFGGPSLVGVRSLFTLESDSTSLTPESSE